MPKIKSRNLISALVFLFFLNGCANTTVHKQTGFLKNYQGFVDSTQFDNTKVYRAEGVDKSTLAQFNEIHLKPFEIWITPSPDRHFNSQQLIELSEHFHQKMRSKLEESGYKMVDRVTSQTLTIRGAFSGIKFDDPTLKATDFIPFRIILNAGNAAYLQVTDAKDVITKVSIELEFLQGVEQKRIFAAMTSKHIDTTVSNDGSDNMKVVKILLDDWVDRFIKRITTIRKEGVKLSNGDMSS